MKSFNFRHPLFPSILAEFTFPLIGYFFWEWNLFYIVMFYAADILSLTVIVGIKQKWLVFPPKKSVKTNQEKKSLWQGIAKTSVVGFIALVLFVVGLSFAYHLIAPQHQSWGAIFMRFFKEEWLLLLVLPLARWMEFSMFFKMRRRYLALSQKGLVNTFIKNQSLIVVFAVIAIVLALIPVSQLIIISLGVTAKLAFDLWKMQQL